MDNSWLGSSTLHIKDSSMRLHSQVKMSEEVIAWWNLEEHEADVLPDAHPSRTPEDRHGQFLLRQLKPEHRRILHEITLTGQNVLRGDDLEGGQPLQEVLIWKEVNLYSVVTSVIFLCF